MDNFESVDLLYRIQEDEWRILRYFIEIKTKGGMIAWRSRVLFGGLGR